MSTWLGQGIGRRGFKSALAGAATLGVTATLVKKEIAPEVDFGAIKRRIQSVLEDETWQQFSVRAVFAPEV